MMNYDTKYTYNYDSPPVEDLKPLGVGERSGERSAVEKCLSRNEEALSRLKNIIDHLEQQLDPALKPPIPQNTAKLEEELVDKSASSRFSLCLYSHLVLLEKSIRQIEAILERLEL